MSEEALDNVAQDTPSTIPAGGTETSGAPETSAREESFPKFEATPDKSILRQQIEHAAKVEEKKRGNPYRGEGGKFTNKPEDSAVNTAAEKAPATQALQSETNTAPQQPQTVAMPKSWSADKQELWTSLPQAAKDFILSRENQVNEGFAKYQGLEPKYKALDAVLSPLDPMIQSYGTTREAFVQQLAGWHQALASNPQEAFPALARAYGYSINQGPSAAEQAQQPGYVTDPRVDQLTPVVSQLQQKLADAERREAEAQMRQTSEMVSKWASDKPHYDKVRIDMGLLIKAAAESGREMSLDEAYQKATWANPEIADQLKKAEFEAIQKKAAEDAKKAKLAAVSASTRPAAGPAANGAEKPGNLRSDITAALRAYQGAGRA